MIKIKNVRLKYDNVKNYSTGILGLNNGMLFNSVRRYLIGIGSPKKIKVYAFSSSELVNANNVQNYLLRKKDDTSTYTDYTINMSFTLCYEELLKTFGFIPEVISFKILK